MRGYSRVGNRFPLLWAGQFGHSAPISMTDLNRRDHVMRLAPKGAICAELGVAQGFLSHRFLSEYDNLGHLYSIDMWAGDRGHDVDEYRFVIKLLTPFREKNTILKLRFDQALDIFPDEYFDLIYVDGYAHTGQEGGQTLEEWFPKLKKGGIFSGDDYSNDWPETRREVNNFIARHDLLLNIINCKEDNMWSEQPTWYVIK